MIAYSVLILLGLSLTVDSQTTGVTTRYWDCCKASCGWTGKLSSAVSGESYVTTCAKDGVTAVDPNTQNVCGGGGNPGPAYMCASNQPYQVNSSLAFGFAAAAIAGQTEPQWCCACYELTFTSTALATAGKKMVVQITNTGGDLSSNHFDIQIPGGGVGIYNGCQNQYGAPAEGWGAQYGGVSSASDCSSLPSQLQSGCNFRFGWFQDADNPNVNLKQVQCPNSIVAKTNCRRGDESSFPNGYLNL
jgi:hypothetical protein